MTKPNLKKQNLTPMSFSDFLFLKENLLKIVGVLAVIDFALLISGHMSLGTLLKVDGIALLGILFYLYDKEYKVNPAKYPLHRQEETLLSKLSVFFEKLKSE
jgi:hypothetical protein